MYIYTWTRDQQTVESRPAGPAQVDHCTPWTTGHHACFFRASVEEHRETERREKVKTVEHTRGNACQPSMQPEHDPPLQCCRLFISRSQQAMKAHSRPGLGFARAPSWSQKCVGIKRYHCLGIAVPIVSRSSRKTLRRRGRRSTVVCDTAYQPFSSLRYSATRQILRRPRVPTRAFNSSSLVSDRDSKETWWVGRLICGSEDMGEGVWI